MKFAWKLALALWIGICVVYGLNGWERFTREARLFETDMQRDHFVMGRGIGSAVAEVWQDEGQKRALELLQRVNQRESQVQIRWVDPGAPDAVYAPSAPTAGLAALAHGEPAVWVDRSETSRLYSYVPVLVNGRWTGAIELSESLSQERQYLSATLLRMALTSGSLAVVSGGVAIAIGIVLVGRPIRLLADKARRVGSGDFSGALELKQRDELGELATEMNAMADRLAEAKERVEREMAARIAAIDQLRHGERLMTVGKLASGVAHELGTPLNVITQRARMAATGEIDGPEARENAAIIAEQSERITRIVRQLLDFARQRTPETSRRDLVGIAERTVVLLTPLAGKQHVTLTLERPETPVHAEVDAMQIQQVLTNLLVNGIQAMPDGGNLRVRVGSGEASPPPDVGQRTRWAWVEVLDEGPGIPPEHLDHLFDPFFTTKPPGEGTGLGLPVAYGIVREHGGWIRVASPPGRGACFTVHLPEAES